MLDVQLCPGYRPHKFQRRVHRSRARFLSMSAGTRAGKTNGAAAEFVLRIYRDLAEGRARPCVGVGNDRRAALHYWVVSPTVQLLKEPKRYLLEMIPAALFETPTRPINSQGQMWLKGDILVEFRSADNPFSLVSVGLNGMWIDEAARIKAEAWKGNLRGRLTDKRGWALFSSTPLGRNWLYDDVVVPGRSDDARYADYEDITWTTADNEYIDPAEVEQARLTLPWRYFQREYQASYDAFLGNIYDEFAEPIHIITEAQLRAEYGLPAQRPLRELFRRVVAGVDWGWTSPGAIAVIGDVGRERILLEESYAPNRMIFDPRDEGNTWVGVARALMLKWGVSQFFYDPSEPQFAYDFERSGLPVTGAFNEIGYGIRKMTEQLHPIEGKPRMRVLNACTNFIREARAYVWDQTRGHESYKESPAPNQSDHCLDAARYAIVELVKYEDASSAGGADERRGRAGRPLG